MGEKLVVEVLLYDFEYSKTDKNFNLSALTKTKYADNLSICRYSK